MADSSFNNMKSLARALSQPKLDLIEMADVCPPRSIQLHPCRRRKLTSCNSIESLETATSPSVAEARVLVINTGGTIGMTLHDNVLAPKANAFVMSLRKLPILHDEMYAQQTSLYDYYDYSENTLVLPKPTPHSDHLFHGCCSTGSIVCACTELQSGLMSSLSLRLNVRVCLPDRKCMPTWPLAIGENTRQDTGARSCVLLEVFLCLLLCSC